MSKAMLLKHVFYYEWVELNNSIYESWPKDFQELWRQYIEEGNFLREQLVKISDDVLVDLSETKDRKYVSMLERFFSEFGTADGWGGKEVNILMNG